MKKVNRASKSSKLTLNKSTLRHLLAKQLDSAAGGYTGPRCVTGVTCDTCDQTCLGC